MTKTVLAIYGDTQIGSTTALAPPTFTIHNSDPKQKQEVSYNPIQQWMWPCWVDFWDYVKTLAGVRGKHRTHRIVTVHLGDVIDGNHHGTYQIIQDVGDQIQVAKDVLQPIVDMSDAAFGIIGTEAHAGPAGRDEIDIYKSLGFTEYGQNMMLEVDGKIHDFAHHGRIGRRDWTSQAASIGVEVGLDCARYGMRLPDYIHRAHNHIIDDSGDKLEGTRVYCYPSWQLKTAFGHRVGANKIRSDIGAVVVVDGVMDTSHTRYKGQPDGRRIIKV